MKNGKKLGLVIAALLMSSSANVSALQAVLDTGFSSDGYVSYLASGVSNTYDVAYGIALQSDGKLIAAGATATATEGLSVVRRYLSNGQLDTTFGSGGTATNNFSDYASSYSSELGQIALQSDGKIVSVGFAIRDNGAGGWSKDALVARFNSNGSLDTTFSGDGFATFRNLGGAANNIFIDVEVDGNGKIIVAGSNDTYGTLLRLNSDGSLDTGFGTSGITVSTGTAGGNRDTFNKMALDSNGKIIVVGSARTPSPGAHNSIAVWRFNTNGSLDNTFGTAGHYHNDTVGGQPGGSAASVIIDNGKIVIAGSGASATASSIGAVVRMTDSGILDTTFSGDGISLLSDNQYTQSIQPDGNGGYFVGGGSYVSSTNSDSVVWKINSVGSLDTTFDSDGLLALPNFTTFTDEWSDIYDLVFTDGSLYFAALPFDNLNFTGNAWVVGKISVGNVVVNIPSGVTVTDTSGNPVSTPLSGTQAVILAKASNVPIVGLSADFSAGNVDLSGVFIDTSITDGKAVVAGLTTVHSLYIPKRAGDVAAIVCPHALTLAAVQPDCTDVQTYTINSPNASVVTVGGKEFWKIDGLTGTGGYSTAVLSSSAPNTGLKPTSLLFASVKFFAGVSILLICMYEIRSRYIKKT